MRDNILLWFILYQTVFYWFDRWSDKLSIREYMV